MIRFESGSFTINQLVGQAKSFLPILGGGSDPLRTHIPILMTSTTAKTPILDLASIFDAALLEYTKQTGINPITCPFAEKLLDCNSPESVIQLLEETAQKFQDVRGGHPTLSKWLPPVVQVVYLVSGVLGHTAALVSLKDIRRL